LNKIKVGAVSYLNTKPLLYGIKNSLLINKIELIEEYPSIIAQMLLDNTIDVGLVPVAIIPKLNEHHIISNYCIGATKEVASVCLFSEVPLEKIESVFLDYQSRTSVNLFKILMKEYWQKDFKLIEAKVGYQQLIKGTTAGVVIGDRALQQRLISPYVYDLASAWISYHNLPIVFAAWIANKQLNQDFIHEFNAALALGLNKIDAVIKEQGEYSVYDLNKYYSENISYELTLEKRKGLELFLKKLKSI